MPSRCRAARRGARRRRSARRPARRSSAPSSPASARSSVDLPDARGAGEQHPLAGLDDQVDVARAPRPCRLACRNPQPASRTPAGERAGRRARRAWSDPGAAGGEGRAARRCAARAAHQRQPAEAGDDRGAGDDERRRRSASSRRPSRGSSRRGRGPRPWRPASSGRQQRLRPAEAAVAGRRRSPASPASALQQAVDDASSVPHAEPSSAETTAASELGEQAGAGLADDQRRQHGGQQPDAVHERLRRAGRRRTAAPGAAQSRPQAQKTTPKATPRTAVTTMSTVRQRRAALGVGTGGRRTDGLIGHGLPPDSLRRHDPDQVRGSAVSRTLSAEALPCCEWFVLLCRRA